MGFDKICTPLCGIPPVLRSYATLRAAGCTKIVASVHAQSRALLADKPDVHCVTGGETRFASVWNALQVAEGEIALIHDAARCMLSADLARDCIAAAQKEGSGVAAIPLADSIMRQNCTNYTPVPRENCFRMQTPQAFSLSAIRSAYAHVRAQGLEDRVTDDAGVYLQCHPTIRLVRGSEENRKLTTAEDWQWAQTRLSYPVFGTGFDTHRLVLGRKLILGGVEIPFDKGLLGHSDADVLLHAICDALLGAAALGDIGQHFPDHDPRFSGADSRVLLRAVRDMVQKRDMSVLHIDATLLCQQPKLAPHIPAMRACIATDLRLPIRSVSIKATTTEGMNDEGRGLCISAQAIATVGICKT
jgi:2-C-methyl-D-erythritol 4-phosphate cytidylyltransferase/2-C-methyl-D-erythritol 2,4-cyclodiphosphate synthase